jgi:hypothetical protein
MLHPSVHRTLPAAQVQPAAAAKAAKRLSEAFRSSCPTTARTRAHPSSSCRLQRQQDQRPAVARGGKAAAGWVLVAVSLHPAASATTALWQRLWSQAAEGVQPVALHCSAPAAAAAAAVAGPALREESLSAAGAAAAAWRGYLGTMRHC